MRAAPAQHAIYDFVVKMISERGLPPTRAEIARHFGYCSSNAAQCALEGLQRKGFIRLVPGVARGIQLVAP